MNNFTHTIFTRSRNSISKLIAILGLLIAVAISGLSYGQTQPSMVVRGSINGFGNSAMTYRASLNQTWITTIQATSSNSNAGFLFANNNSFSPKWSRGDAVTINAQTDWYNNTGDGTYNQVNGRFYTFIIRDAASFTNTRGYLFETTAAPVTVSTVSQSPIAANVVTGNAVTVTATTSANLPTGQGVFLRYSTNNFSTSTVVNMTGSGTSYAATIPAATNTAGATVVYYVFTSGGTAAISSADADFATINLNNNNGSNYSYNVTSITPAISAVSAAPNNGISTNAYNGSTITLNGTNLAGVTLVTLSSNPANPITIPSNVSNTVLSFTLPSGYSGTATVSHPTNGSSTASATSISNIGFISTGSGGNWNVGASWLGGTAPSASTNLATISSGAPITLNTNIAIANLTINSSGIFTASDATPRTITISNGGLITNNGIFTAGDGTVAFAGSATVSGTLTFNNATIAGGVNFGIGSTISGNLTINPGGFVSTNAPTYNSSATLRYNTGGPYGRGTEWSATSGRGYPHHVQISGNTTLDVHNGQDTQRQIAGNLTVDTGSTFTTSSMNVADQPIGVIILGNIINDGTFTLATSADRVRCVNFNNNSGATATLSTAVGGDLELTGNLIDNATFNANTRAVFFTGSGTQDISGSGTFAIDYMVLNKPSGTVRLLNNLLCEGPNGGNAITLTNTTDILDLNGFTATFGKTVPSPNQVNSGFAGNGFIRGGGNSSIILLGDGVMGTFRFDQTIPGTTNGLNNLTINRTGTASIILGNPLLINNTLTLQSGQFIIASSELTLRGPIVRTSPGIVSPSTGTIIFSGDSPQTIPAGSFNSFSTLTISNTSGVTSSQTISVSSTLNVDGILNMQTFALGGNFSVTSGIGKLRTQNSSSTPIPTNRTWNFEVELHRNGNQTVPVGTYSNLTLTTGGIKSIVNSVNISGDLVVTSPATASVGQNISFTGSSTQNIAGLAYNNIVFSGVGTKTFTSNASVSSQSVLSFSEENIGTVDFDGTSDDLIFELKSDIQGTTQVSNSNGWILSGKVVAQRFMPSKRAWRLLTSPLKGASNSSIFENWQGVDQEGVLLWHPQGTPSNGLTVGPQPNIWSHNGTNWNAVTDTTVPNSFYNEEKNNSFLVFPVGPHGSGNIAYTDDAFETTLKPRGNLITGDVTYNNLTANRYHLIGNPYASPLNTESLSMSNPDFTFWLLDPSLGILGGYYTFNGIEWTPLPPNDFAGEPDNTFIQSGQAFFVRSSTSSSFVFEESHKEYGNSDTWFERSSIQNTTDNKIRVLLDKQTNNQWQLADGILSVSGSNYANEVNQQDALKVSNFNENILFRNGTSNLAIEYLNLPILETMQPIRLTGTSAISYRLRVRTEGYVLSDLQPVLQDTQTGTNHIIPTDGSTIEIPFTGVVSNASNPDARFRIVYESVLNIDQPTASNFSVYPNPVDNGQFHIDFRTLPSTASYTISTLLGQHVQQGTLTDTRNTVFLTHLEKGIYLLQVTQDDKVITKKLYIQ
ncbi:T9SS type A sorting domain-containing protein [Flavobacterium lacus]|uniref:Putative secreted protein (Por secretion system target) n=1 Tax=Flavobacterium lacus TaxID=1353778 RepID=A0A328WRZ7_9FLAO|nr:T9SS type A sorting domain-containing protein [Flavobacterium lacus]RAR47217.1 putative secreted protein (Por secretion system target) [Flavobacterium lacus]